MEDTYRVIMTDAAASDLEEIAEHIARQSEQNAPIEIQRILDRAERLAIMPTRFKKVGKSRTHGSPIHGLVVRPFIVYYRVDEHHKAVFLLRVFHGAQMQPKYFD